MITYVNTVLVSNLNSSALCSAEPTDSAGGSNYTTDAASADAGKFIIKTVNGTIISTVAGAQAADAIKIGLVTDKNAPQINPSTGAVKYIPVVKWSNVITADGIKSATYTGYASDTEDAITIDFSSVDDALVAKWAEGGKRIITRLTFKDMPHRFRKWTESYEYVTTQTDLTDDPSTAGTDESATKKLAFKRAIVTAIANKINREWKRARVVATTDVTTSNTAKLILTAKKYDDDNAVDSLNWANQVRFNANMYWTDPAAEGWESLNKNFPKGVTITKVPGKYHVGSAKLVRDREAGAMGYQGILNRGEGTWPIIKPEMQTKLNGHYDSYVIEFERLYRTADDLQRRTKESVEIYCQDGGLDGAAGVKAIIDGFVG